MAFILNTNEGWIDTKNVPKPIQNQLKNNGEMDKKIVWCELDDERSRSTNIKIIIIIPIYSLFD